MSTRMTLYLSAFVFLLLLLHVSSASFPILEPSPSTRKIFDEIKKVVEKPAWGESVKDFLVPFSSKLKPFAGRHPEKAFEKWKRYTDSVNEKTQCIQKLVHEESFKAAPEKDQLDAIFSQCFHIDKQENDYSPPSPPTPSLKTVLKIQDSAPSPSPSYSTTPQGEHKVVRLLKQYFYDFGYYPTSVSGEFTNKLDNNFTLAVRNYQTYFKLANATDTVKQILRPRCGVPDMNYDFERNLNLSWPKGRFPGGKKNLTYSFEPESRIPKNMTAVFRRAFQRWSESIPGVGLSFTEATSPDNADIKVGLYDTDRNFDKLVVADTVMESNIEHDSNVVGKVRLDYEESWALPDEDLGANDIDLETVAMHQIGHLLGLAHSNDTDAIMYPYILPSKQRKVELTHDDIQKTQQLYASTAATQQPYASTAADTFPFPSGFLLTAAFIILVY